MHDLCKSLDVSSLTSRLTHAPGLGWLSVVIVGAEPLMNSLFGLLLPFVHLQGAKVGQTYGP
jgi:hypothetical protein